MLPKQLNAIRENLSAKNKKNLSESQLQLLHELNFLSANAPVQTALGGYSYEEDLFESFVMAKTHCPNCGKKY